MIILLLFVHDNYRFYELKSKLKSSAYLVASMIQQLSNTRSDKQLTSTDLAHIVYASCLNLFHSNSVFNPSPFGIYYDIEFVWVKRISNDSYQYQSCYAGTGSGKSPSTINKGCQQSVSTKTKNQIQIIDPNLICEKDGDERLLIEACYRRRYSTFNKKQLGFFLLEPKTMQSSLDWSTNNFFIYHLVITPKPGLFPGKNN